MKNKQRRIELKEYRLRRSHKQRLLMKSIRLVEPSLIKPYIDKSLKYLDKTFNVQNHASKIILIPHTFSFERGFDQTVKALEQIVGALMNKPGHVTIDFSNCHFVSFSVLFFLKQILKQYLNDQERFVKSIASGKLRKVRVKIAKPQTSEELKVLKYLHALDLFRYESFQETDGEYLLLQTIEGRFKGYKNNRKGIASHKIVDYINESYSPLKKQLTNQAKNLIESLVSEMLNNAEDHCLFKNDWYVSGITFHDKADNQDILELNLVIFNYGNSMFEGFKQQKHKTLKRMQNLKRYINIIKNNLPKMFHLKKNLCLLYTC